MRTLWLPVFAVAFVACAKEEAAPAPAAVSLPPAVQEGAPLLGDLKPTAAQPVKGQFIGGTRDGVAVMLTPEPCAEVVVAVAEGTTKVAGEDLSQWDAVLLRAPDPPVSIIVAKGGTALLAQVFHPCIAGEKLLGTKQVIRSSKASELTWGGGAMHAHLDAEKDVSPDFYFGRLAGTAPVTEHMHAGSWEALFAFEATGTFTIDGHPQKLGRYGVAYVPPDTKHSWAPDPGSKLVAFQIYDPPGPEQRFKGYAAAGK
jgi:mannose-6-phosphate isomerase-like protein (cupin superfamily)